MMKKIIFILALVVIASGSLDAQKKKEPAAPAAKKETKFSSSTFSALSWRGIGPAWASGRISDFAVNPSDHSEIYVAVSAGNIWKSNNNGVTWKPIFDNYGSYSIGCLTIDPDNHNVIWAGSGENNHQRALGYGDGVYKSEDGGKSWKNMGLKESRQIGMIAIDPRNSDVVYVAAEGSVWGPGGERGLYKTTDGGNTWTKVLNISENTGVNNVILDPRNPDVVYATSEQRRRHVYTKVGGGPESAVYRSKDGGKSFEKIMKGLPGGHIGGMGMAISPVNPDILYLIVEAAGESSGFFRSENRGASWEKMSSHNASGQYYNEIVCDPVDVNRVFSMETVSQVTVDGGKTWKALGNNDRHVDDHAIWIDPTNTKHWYIGGDGGIYETWDDGANYIFKSNFPVTQFYRVFADNAFPFYNVYGGTQDNNSMGGPSRSLKRNGVVNDDWYVTQGGDGFWIAVDPVDENIIYTESQYGNAARLDKKSGESVSIKPWPPKGEQTYRWNWDTPLAISHFNREHIYMAANKLFKSNDRGSSWDVISGDLTRNEDRNQFKVMDKFWSADAVAKDVSTSLWGTLVSFSESTLKDGLIYTGSDDGVVAVTTDGGKTWNMTKTFPGVPEYTYVSDVMADRFNENVVYATFNNLKSDDFKPYILKSSDQGKTWSSISGNLPANGSVHTIAQDFVNPNLLFVGTEFSFFFSVDGGQEWIQLKGGLPTIPVRDIAIQERENDLVIATFGRGFYIIDDYTPLRHFNEKIQASAGYIFPVKDALMYSESRGFDNQGSMYYTAPNPAFGATFTYYVKDVPKTDKAIRTEKEKALFEKGEIIPQLSWKAQEDEGKEIAPYLIFTITDRDGNVVKKLYKSASKGTGRITWNFRYDGFNPVNTTQKFNPLGRSSDGIMAMPGDYNVALSMYAKGDIKQLTGPVKFTCKPLGLSTFPVTNEEVRMKWLTEASDYARTVYGAVSYANDLSGKLNTIMQVLHQTSNSTPAMVAEANRIAKDLDDIMFKFNGLEAKASWEEIPPQDVPLSRRLSIMAYGSFRSAGDISQIAKEQFDIMKIEFPPMLEIITKAGEDIAKLEKSLDAIKAPWTPGRVPKF